MGSMGAVASGRGPTGRRPVRRRFLAPSPAMPRRKWRLGRPGRTPKWFLEQQGAGEGKGAEARAPKATAALRATRPPSEKQHTALAKAQEARATKREPEGAGAE